MDETNIKSAFDEVYDTLEELLTMNEANPKCYEDDTSWQHLIDVSNSVLTFWQKLRKEP